MNNSWGFKLHDQEWKSSADLIRKLVDVASKGGNFLLNIGPDALGRVPEQSVERLQAVGRWTAANGEAIYGTTASLFAKLPWGRCTQKTQDGRTRLYLHLFEWPKDGKLLVPGLKSSVKSAELLAGGKSLVCERQNNGVLLHLPATAPDPAVSVIRLELADDLVVENPRPRPGGDGAVCLPMWMADIGNEGYGGQAYLGDYQGSSAILGWTDARTWLAWQFEIDAPGSYEVLAAVSPEKPGASMEVRVGRESFVSPLPMPTSPGKIPPVVLGTLSIPTAGVHELKLKPAKPGWQPAILHEITLRPVRSSSGNPKNS
jgi:alpha-L-fucosidase